MGVQCRGWEMEQNLQASSDIVMKSVTKAHFFHCTICSKVVYLSWKCHVYTALLLSFQTLMLLLPPLLSTESFHLSHFDLSIHLQTYRRIVMVTPHSPLILLLSYGGDEVRP